MASSGTIKSCLSDARGQVTGISVSKPALPQLAAIRGPGESKQLTPTPPAGSSLPNYRLNALKSPRKLRPRADFTDDTFLYAEKNVNPVIERLAQQLVLHNPPQQQIQNFVEDAIHGKSLSTKYPVNRDLITLKASVGVKSEPKKLLPVSTRKVLDNLVLAIFKTRPIDVKTFILETSKCACLSLHPILIWTGCCSDRHRKNSIVDQFHSSKANATYAPQRYNSVPSPIGKGK
jgi:hypothetical protein